MRTVHAALIAAFACVAMPAAAQDVGRYTLEKTRDGYVRMDNRTGEMSTCTDSGGQLVCRLAADDRDAYQDELDRLQGKLEEVEKRVAALEGDRAPAQEALPTEETFQQALNFMERFFRTFVGVVKDLDKELRGEEPPAAPQKT